MLRELTYKGVYRSDQDSILEDFYFKTLSVSCSYDRAVGFFSASTISYAAQALSVFVKRRGKIRLILGAFTDTEDIEAVELGYKSRDDLSSELGESILSEISEVNDELFQNRFDTLSWLVANGRLDIKIALRERGMFHDKVGIIADSDGDSVVFSGSANESSYALLPTHNYESINVFRSWVPEHEEFYSPHKECFNRLWHDKSKGTIVIGMPTALKERIVSAAKGLDYAPDSELEMSIAERWKVAKRSSAVATPMIGGNPNSPMLPKSMFGRPFELRDHQKATLRHWKSEGDFQGVFELATGAGKTITAIFGATRISEFVPSLACIIAVPYQNLADQWVEALNLFNIYPVKCYVSTSNWKDELSKMILDLSFGARKFGAIVVVNRTLKSVQFQENIRKLDRDKLLWIGDECHHHASRSFSGDLPDARFKIGLSATPEHYIDEERNDRLFDYYGSVVYRYTLKQAVEDEVLTPYMYFPHIVELTISESEEFIELSDKNI